MDNENKKLNKQKDLLNDDHLHNRTNNKTPKWVKMIICMVPILLLGIYFVVGVKFDNNSYSTDEKIYQVYLLATKSGEDVSYEDWLHSLNHDEMEIEIQGTNVMWKYKRETEWKLLYNILDFTGNDGLDGVDGQDGTNGLSAYEIWETFNKGKTEEEFLESLSLYAFWASKPENAGKTEEQFLEEMKGEDGEDGVDVSYPLYLIYKALGYTKTFESWKEEYGTKVDGELDFIVDFQVTFYGEDTTTPAKPPIKVKKGEKIPTNEVPLVSKTDHVLVGWFYDNNGVQEQWIFTGYVVTQSIDLYAKFAPITYDVAYELDGGVNNSENKNKLENSFDTIELKKPTKEGYEFVKWVDATGSVIEIMDKDNTFAKAVWTESIYYITYHLDGGENSLLNPPTIKITDFIYLSDPIKEGNKFLRWTDNDGNTVTSLNVTKENIELTAHWEPMKYTITYVTDGNIITDSLNQGEINFGESITLEPYYKEHYIFLGWYSGPLKLEELQNVTSDIVLEAKWSEVSYEINYVMNNGINSIHNPKIVTATNNNITLLEPIRIGYEFVRWVKGFNDPVTEVTIENYMHIQAEWTPNSYNIQYKDTMGSPNALPTTIEYDTYLNLGVLERTGYDFLGWYDERNVLVESLFNVTSDVILYAKWKIKTFTITYLLDGGNEVFINPKSITYEESVDLASPTKEHYVFLGWYDASISTPDQEPITTLENILSNKTLEARWGIKVYTITYELNGGIILGASNVTSITYFETSPLQSPEKIACEFLGWYSLSTKYDKLENISSDITLEARWNVENFKITYDIDNGDYNDDNPTSITYYDYDDENPLTLLDAYRAHYDFIGWYNSDDYDGDRVFSLKNVDEDICLVARWRVTNYNVYYELNGGTSDNRNLTSINVYTKIDGIEGFPLWDSYREGYKFDGWFSDLYFKEQVVSVDLSLLSFNAITIYAKFTQLVFTDSYGEYLYFGTYPQSLLEDSSLITLFNNSNKTGTFIHDNVTYTKKNSSYYKHDTIRWNVISKTSTAYTVVSHTILEFDSLSYDSSFVNFGSSILSYSLNNTFYNKAFNISEKSNMMDIESLKISIPSLSDYNTNRNAFINCRPSDYVRANSSANYNNIDWMLQDNKYFSSNDSSLSDYYYANEYYGIKPVIKISY